MTARQQAYVYNAQRKGEFNGARTGIAAQSAEASFVIDDQQRIVEWTGGTAELLGASAETIVGRTCYEVARGHDPFGQPFCGLDCLAFKALKSGRLSSTRLLRTNQPGTGKAWLRCNLIALPRAPGGALLSLSKSSLQERSEQSDRASPIPHASAVPFEGLVKDLAAQAVLSTSLSADDLQQTFDRSLDWLRQATGAEAAEIFVSGPQGMAVFLTAFRGPFRAAFSQITHFRIGEGFPGLVLKAEEPILTRELSADPRYLRARVKKKGFLSYVCVPLKGMQGVFGVLNVASRRPDLDLERALRIMTWASQPIAMALQAVLLQARQTEIAGKVGELLNPEQAFEGLLRVHLRRMMMLGHATGGVLVLYDPNNRACVRHVAEGSPTRLACPSLGSSALEGCPALATCEAISLCGPRRDWPASCQLLRLRGSLIHCLPLVVEGHRVGVVSLEYDHQTLSPPSRYLAVLLGAAEQVAQDLSQAWANLRYYQRAVAMVDEWKQERVEDISSARGAPTDPASEPDSSDAWPEHLLLDIRCLGPFEIYRGTQPVPPEMFTRRDALTLLKILLLHRGKQVTYDQLAEMLQPEGDPRLAVNRLHVLVHTLRRLLEPSAQRPWLFIRNDGGGYCFNLDAPHRLDLQAFLDSIALGGRLEGKSEVARATDAYEMAISLYRGDLFEDDPYADWCREEREILREAYLDTLGRLAGLHREQGETERSIELSRRALKIDPLRERMHLGLIKDLWLEGRPAEALRHYGVCRDILQRELGTTPSPEIEQLAQNIRNSARA